MDCPRWLESLLPASDDRSAAAIEREIDEELDAHLDLLMEECTADGLLPTEARCEAKRRFGPRELYRSQCRRIDLGDRIMFQRVVVAVAVVLAGLTGFLLWDVRTMRRQHAEAIAELNRELAEMQSAERFADPTARTPATLADLTGRVVDADSNPLADVQLMIVVKTWPNNRYQQRAYHTTSLADGSFTLKKRLPVGEQYAVHAAAVREGYALSSKYQLKERGDPEPLAPVVLQLAPAEPVNLTIEDADGNRIRGAKAALAGRTAVEGEEHSVYFQASEPLHKRTNEQGQVELDWCAGGDEVELYVQAPGEDWRSYRVEIPVDATETLLIRTGGDGA